MNSYTKDMVEVHLTEPRSLVCDRCDVFFEDIKKYYEIHKPENNFESSRKYCRDCVNFIQVRDWREE